MQRLPQLIYPFSHRGLFQLSSICPKYSHLQVNKQLESFSFSQGDSYHCKHWSSIPNAESQLRDIKSEDDSKVQSTEKAVRTFSDDHKILRFLPPAVVPYAELMRLEKPIGTWLLIWPSYWSIGLAASPGSLPDLQLLFLFGVGAVLLRGAGCTVNDLWDRDLDRKVERTRTRPIAAGLISVPQGIAFLTTQLLLGLGILLQLNGFAQALGASSLLLVGSYPLMKRVTYWPQAFLGLTINWGALLGYAAAQGHCNWSIVLPLYLSGACWSLVYDTIYAHQDVRDDARVGVKSTALLFGKDTKTCVSAFAALQVGLLCAAGHAAAAGAPFYVGAAAAAAHLAWQIRTANLNDGRDCMAKFVSNQWTGAMIFTGIVADKLLL